MTTLRTGYIHQQIPLPMFRNWWLLALKGLLLLVMGAYVLFNAELALAALVFYLGLLALVGGVAEVALAILNRDKPQWTGYLLEGLLDVGIGVLLLAKPGVVSLIPIMLGIWIVASGILLLVRTMRARQEGGAYWANWLVLSLLLVLLGLWLIFDPTGTLVSVTWLLGLVMFAFGLLVLLIAFRLRSSNKAIKKAAEDLEARGL
jgi:uncharacterized membrane protein HdeD (DUF308 family)